MVRVGGARRAGPSRRAVLRGTWAIPVGALAAACGAARTGPASRPGGPTVDPPPPGTRRQLPPGVVGDGGTDDGPALQRALDALRPGGRLVLPAGATIAHRAVLTVRTAGVTLSGGATLSALEEGTSSLQLLADDITVTGLTLAVPHTTHRWSAPAQHRLLLGAHRGIVVRGVTVTGSAAAGIFSDGAQHFSIEEVSVSDTRADGIHLTNGSAYGTVTSPRVSRSGDDAVAVVSYQQDGRPCHDITVTDPVVRTTTGGRGISVVGGHTVTYRGIDIDRSAAAAVYVACEGSPYDTFPTSAVQVVGGVVTGANTDSSIDHGAVLVFSGRGGGSVEAVTISGLQVSGTRRDASRQIGVVRDGGGQVGGVRFDGLTLAPAPLPYQGNVEPSAVALVGVTAAGRPVRV